MHFKSFALHASYDGEFQNQNWDDDDDDEMELTEHRAQAEDARRKFRTSSFVFYSFALFVYQCAICRNGEMKRR